MTDFLDQFSSQAQTYRNSRPTYPQELYDFIVNLCHKRELAWDCATGNGQSAIHLAEYFNKVIATDASAEQIQHAMPHAKVEYSVATAYSSGLKNASADIITVATAAHWFQIDRFYTEADRVLKPDGILAIWSYAGCRVDEAVNTVLDKFSFDILGDYWSPEIWRVWRDKYVNLPFPYPQLEHPQFQTKLNWKFEQLLNYINSWSGVQNYKNRENKYPVELIETELRNAWGTAAQKQITWNLYMKIGRKP